MVSTSPAPGPQRRSRGGIAIIAAVLAVGVAGAFFLGRMLALEDHEHLASRPSPNVILAMRDLSRLESATFHMEKVIELTDEQSRLFGLVQAKDQILLVAVGDVVAGVDMAKLPESDVHVDAADGSVHVVLPAPEVLSTAIDEKLTHVYGRSTDLLAERKEELETLARKEAAQQIEKGARDGGILDRARSSAERTLRALVLSLGYKMVVVEWKG
jgi:hypothetical protein